MLEFGAKSNESSQTMSRRARLFKQHDVSRLVKATLAGGVAVGRVEFDLGARKIAVVAVSTEDTPRLSDLDEWLNKKGNGNASQT
jgi:hypothetical protein